jgi:hypothetical protein
MRPRRTSVALWTEGKLRAFVEAAMEGIINSRWSFVVGRWQIEFRMIQQRERLTTSDRLLRRRDSQTHIHRRQ